MADPFINTSPGRWAIVQGNRSVQEVHEEVWKYYNVAKKALSARNKALLKSRKTSEYAFSYRPPPADWLAGQKPVIYTGSDIE